MKIVIIATDFTYMKQEFAATKPPPEKILATPMPTDGVKVRFRQTILKLLKVNLWYLCLFNCYCSSGNLSNTTEVELYPTFLSRFRKNCSVDHEIPVEVLEFQYGSWVFIYGPGIAVWILECVDPGATVCFLELKSESWYSSVDVGIPVWILGFQYGFWDSRGIFGILASTLCFQCRYWDFSVIPGIPVWILRFQCSFLYSSTSSGISIWSLDFNC